MFWRLVLFICFWLSVLTVQLAERPCAMRVHNTNPEHVQAVALENASRDQFLRKRTQMVATIDYYPRA